MTRVDDATEIGAVPCATKDTNLEAVVTPEILTSPTTVNFDPGSVVPIPRTPPI